MTSQPTTPLVELTQENYRPILGRDGIVLVDCWASSCGACKVLGPIYADVAAKHPRHTFAKLNTLAEDQLVSALGIVNVPTLMLYRDGIMLFQQEGNFDEARLEDIISQAEALDMDAVRAEIERAESAARPPETDES